MKRSSLVAVIVAALVVIGIVIYLARPRPEEFDVVRPGETASASQPAANPGAPAGSGAVPATVAACLGPVSSPQGPLAALNARHEWARSLESKNHYDTALPEFRNIAATDPGYPGINLDISNALLRSKHAAEASDAINVQLELSDCLAKLSDNDVQAYCKSQWTTTPASGCGAELAKIDAAAKSEEKQVKVEMARGAAPAMVARSTPPLPVARAVPAKVVATVQSVAPEPVVEKPLPPKPPVLLKAADASGHIGERATVCGLVVSKNTSAQTTGKPTFINLDKPFPNPTFTVVVWDADSAQTGELPGSGDLCVTGTITLYRGTPEIVVRDAKNWSHPPN